MALVSYSTLPTGPSTGINGTNQSVAGQGEAGQFVSTFSGTIDTIAWFNAASGANTSVRFAIYVDSAGAPGARVGSEWIVPVASVTNSAWNYFGSRFGGIAVVTAGTTYWLAHLAIGGTINYSDNAASGGTVKDSSSSTLTTLADPATAYGATVFTNIINQGVMGPDPTIFTPRRMPMGA